MPDHAAITPDTKVGELLDRWPGLEEVLIQLSPHFRALRNPVLRRTIAKVATLRQAASVANVPLHLLVDRLRAAAGLPPGTSGGVEGVEAPARPAWASRERVARSRDARAEIEAGGHPLPAVMSDLATLSDGEVYELITPFVPAPLRDLARQRGFDSCSVPGGDGVVRTFFRKDAGAAGAAEP